MRDLWIPAFVGLLGVLISLGGWGLLVSERRSQLLAMTEETAAEITRAVELGLDRQMTALSGLQDLWSRFGLRSEPEWMMNVDQRIAQIPGLASVGWIDLDGPRERVAVGGDGPSPPVEIAPNDPRLQSSDMTIEGPKRDESGTVGYRALLPIRTPDGREGVLVAWFRPDVFLEDLLQARARGYALSVEWEGEEIYWRDEPSQDSWQRWWRLEESVALPMGGMWTIRFQPTAWFAAMRLSPVPHYLLAVGLVLSIALAVVAHQLRVTLRQSRFLAASNRALEQRGLELESRVVERTGALEDAVSELEAFNYSVSHDLRSPLGAILNFATILNEDYRDRALDAEGVAILERITRSAWRATDLLEDLLRLSRAGRSALTVEPVEMTTLARESFAQARAAEGEPEVEFLLDPLPDATGDRSLLGDVFVNLFGNALKYSRGREKRTISVRGRITNSECIYEVSDNGHGFDMRFVDKLFHVFERLHSDEAIEGTGVGLAMVSRIIKRHGGRVWAEGEPDVGASFFFTLPRSGPS